MKALVLSGGGARGAYEAGVIAGLHERGETFDIVCGTSIGAINGALCAQRDVDTMARMWQTIGSEHVITYVSQVQVLMDLVEQLEAIVGGPLLRRAASGLRAYADYKKLRPISALLKLMGAVAPNPIETILARILDFSRLKDTALVVSATNVTTNWLDVFSWFPDANRGKEFAAKQDGVGTRQLTAANYAGAIRASAAIPGAFAPVDVASDGQVYSYVDGGVANNTPIGQAIDAGATEVNVIFMDPKATPSIQSLDNLAQVGLACLGIMQQKILELDCWKYAPK